MHSSLVNGNSLGATLSAVEEALFFGWPLEERERKEVVQWIAGRAAMPRAYCTGMAAPTQEDFQRGAHLFSGELITTKAGVAHVLGEEAARILLTLGQDDADAQCSVLSTTRAMMRMLDHPDNLGRYCCGTCTVSVWRNMAAGGLADQERHLAAGLERLKEARYGDGGWRPYPFYYTLLALSEMNTHAAHEEKRYAAPACERRLRSRMGTQPYATRRQALMERILSQI